MGDLVVACVYRTGGDFDLDYVVKLRNGVARYLKNEHKFFACLTDAEFREPGIHCIPLERGWPGFYSKIELFRPGLFEGCPVLYLDLDTVLVRELTIHHIRRGEFSMLMPFNPQRRAMGYFGSGIMMWRGDFSFIYEGYKGQRYRYGDQQHIYESLFARAVAPKAIMGAVSYKRHCTEEELPREASVVCFHGHPRPHEITKGWVPRIWK